MSSVQSNFVVPLLTDMYQVTMAYAYWKADRHELPAVFDLFFRKNPFGGEFCIFTGLEEVLGFVESYKFQEEHIDFLRTLMPDCEEGFFEYLRSIDCSHVQLHAMKEGTVCFPKEPLIRVEGPLCVCQLLETTLLNLVNFPSLVTTNATRMRLAAGSEPQLLEFGLRRAQGPDGGMSASRYSYMGGFDGTSNVLAGLVSNIPVKGTHAHSFVMSFSELSEVQVSTVRHPSSGEDVEFVSLVLQKRALLRCCAQSNDGELAAFISYAQAFPSGFLALVDTYDSLLSGTPNYLAVGWALHEVGYQPRGIRLDSGDLAYLSTKVREMFKEADAVIGKDIFSAGKIVVSNDINEDVLHSLKNSDNSIDVFAVGTNLVTCQKQPALGCVFKLVEVRGVPRIKLSQDLEKTVIPGRKQVYRVSGARSDYPLVDIIQLASAEPPKPDQRIMCRHPFQEKKRAQITPCTVTPLLHCVWNAGRGRVQRSSSFSSDESIAKVEIIREYISRQVERMRPDHLRYLNPTPYKVSVDQTLYDFMHSLWMKEAPVHDLE